MDLSSTKSLSFGGNLGDGRLARLPAFSTGWRSARVGRGTAPMKRFRGLLGALGALLAIDPELHTQRRRQRAAPTDIDKAHTRAADRKRERDRLSRPWWPLTLEEKARLETLRLQRGKLARRMARRPRKREKNTIPPATKPLHLGHRIPASARVLLLREEGRPVSGRQWRHLRKAARRQERAS